MHKRVYDMAGVLGKTVKTWLNGEGQARAQRGGEEQG